MNLIIVESPTKARTLSRYLGNKDFAIEATMGHIRDLPESKLGVDIEKDFEPSYVTSPKKKDIVARLQQLASKSELIYLASDPDREGEAIAYHVKEILSSGAKSKKKDGSVSSIEQDKFKRITFHEITESAIKESMKHPGSINMDLVEAQTSRRVLDRLVGYKLSPLLWRKIRKGLSAGRVQSVTVRLIVEREKEIEAFIAVEYWEIKTLLEKSDLSGKLLVKLSKLNGKAIDLKNNDDSTQAVLDLNKADYRVDQIDKKEAKRYSPPPFTTSTLQQNAANRLGWSSKKTMQVAQGLYEEGLITYHRTDSTNVAAEAITMTRKFIEETYGNNYLPPKPKFYETKSKSAQEAHEAIRPTGLIADYHSLTVGNDDSRLYDLIFKRFLASQMADAVVEVTNVDVGASVAGKLYTLAVKGEVELFDGWKKLYKSQKVDDKNNKSQDKDDDIDDIDDSNLPKLTVGETLKLIEVIPEQKFTQPPPRFNEASLIKALEELGIGRPSTYAPTISTIQDRQYIEKEDRNFIPTALGIAVNEFLVKYFGNIVDYQFTAQMEDSLDDIASGAKNRVPVLNEFYLPFAKQLAEVEKTAERVAVQTETTGEKCPKCKTGDVVVRVGRFGKFLSCNRFPDCDYRAPFVQVLKGKVCPKCGGDIIYKKTKKGKGFYGCGNYPKCDWASWRKP